MSKIAKVFLGGTCNGSKWRDYAEQHLNMPYFNPVVDDWDEEAMKREEHEKATSLYHLYVLTPKMEGCFSVAELINDSHQTDTETYFCFLATDGGQSFSKHQLKAMQAIARMVEDIGGHYFPDIESTIQELNKAYSEHV